MKLLNAPILLGGLIITVHGWAQPDTMLLAHDEHYVMGEIGEDPSPDLNSYGNYVPQLGGDSVRACGQFPCTGWVEDRYPNGQLKHRGYYDSGRLTLYKTYHPNGVLEREYKPIDEVKSVMRTWHRNGLQRSETRFAKGEIYAYEDRYVSGQLRYVEERHRSEPYFTRMELFAATGEPISILRIVDRAAAEVEQEEYYPGGTLRSKGRSRYSSIRMDSQRVGTWTYFNAEGRKVREEDYIDGKVHAERTF